MIHLTLTEKAALKKFQQIHMIHGQPTPSDVAAMVLRLALMMPDRLSAHISSIFRYMRAEGIESTAAVQLALVTDRIAATLPKRWKSKVK